MIKLKEQTELVFRKRDHTYLADYKAIPSVSDILRQVSCYVYESCDHCNTVKINARYMDAARIKGESIHKAIDTFLNTKELLIEPEYLDYIKQFVLWYKQNWKASWEIVVNEKAFYHPELKYAGTPDLVVFDNETKEILVIDFKTTSKLNTYQTALQVSAYSRLIDVNRIDQSVEYPVYGYVLWLQPDTFEFKQLTPRTFDFLKLLETYKETMKGLKDGKE